MEPKNLIRQNFISQDIGSNKAQILSDRYSELYPKIKVSFVDKYATYSLFDKKYLKGKEYPEEHFVDIKNLNIDLYKDVIINLVDNEGFKKKLDFFVIQGKKQKNSPLYFSAGVNLYNGQVYHTYNFKSNSYVLDHMDIFDTFDEVSVHACADTDANGTADNPEQLFNGNDIAASLLANLYQTVITDIPLYKKINFISGNNMSVSKDTINFSTLGYHIFKYIALTKDRWAVAQKYVSKYGLHQSTSAGRSHYGFINENKLIFDFYEEYLAVVSAEYLNPRRVVLDSESKVEVVETNLVNQNICKEVFLAPEPQVISNAFVANITL